MKYLLIMNTPRDGYTQYLNWPKKILEANQKFMGDFTQKLVKSGEFVGTWGLASPTQARLVRVGKNGQPITDGVFPEAKEYLAGFFLIDVENEQRAIELAAELSSGPGDTVIGSDGRRIEHFWIEVRQVMGSHEDVH